MAGGHAELVWWRALLSGNETLQSVCLCPHTTIATVIQSQGESQVKQRTIGMNVNETICSASIYRTHQLTSWDDFKWKNKVQSFVNFLETQI